MPRNSNVLPLDGGVAAALALLPPDADADADTECVLLVVLEGAVAADRARRTVVNVAPCQNE